MPLPDDPTLRPPCPDDRSGWPAPWQGGPGCRRTAPREETVAMAAARARDPDRPEFRGPGAQTGGRLAGRVHARSPGHPWRSEPVCALRDRSAAAGARARGIGRAPILAAHAEAGAAGAPRVHRTERAPNRTARRRHGAASVAAPSIRRGRPAR